MITIRYPRWLRIIAITVFGIARGFVKWIRRAIEMEREMDEIQNLFREGTRKD